MSVLFCFGRRWLAVYRRHCHEKNFHKLWRCLRKENIPKILRGKLANNVSISKEGKVFYSSVYHWVESSLYREFTRRNLLYDRANFTSPISHTAVFAIFISHWNNGNNYPALLLLLLLFAKTPKSISRWFRWKKNIKLHLRIPWTHRLFSVFLYKK